MKTKKVFYKKKLTANCDGLYISTERFIPIHETKCFYFCVTEHWLPTINYHARTRNTTAASAAKHHKIKIHRIGKDTSRIAFETEEKAFEHLRMLKQKQVYHMERDLAFIKAFLEVDDFEKKHGTHFALPTRFLEFNEHLNLDC